MPATIRRGATYAEVRDLQLRLIALGWKIADDGQFGLRTDAAVRSFQKNHGLDPDGIVGARTWEALKAATPVQAKGTDPIRVLMPVVYRSQRDNLHYPGSTCNVTSVAMVLAHYGIRDPVGKQLEDALFETITSPEGLAHCSTHFPWARGLNPWTVHGMLQWVVQRYGVTLNFGTNRAVDDIRVEVNAGRPVIFAGKFTASGHIVVLHGLTADGDFIAHDPWGDWNTGYRSLDGSSRIYRAADLQALAPNGIWAHFSSRSA